MQDDPTDGADDVDADRDQRLPQPRDLRTAQCRPVGVQLQLLEEHERRGRQRDAQLIGPERVQLVRPKASASFSSLKPEGATAQVVGVGPHDNAITDRPA